VKQTLCSIEESGLKAGSVSRNWNTYI